jgi:hypothetical protein
MPGPWVGADLAMHHFFYLFSTAVIVGRLFAGLRDVLFKSRLGLFFFLSLKNIVIAFI